MHDIIIDARKLKYIFENCGPNYKTSCLKMDFGTTGLSYGMRVTYLSIMKNIIDQSSS